MKKLIFALVTGVAAMGVAHAEGAYIGLGVASSDTTFKIGGASNVDADGFKASPKIFGGVDFTPMWGIEAGYTDLSKADVNYRIGTANLRNTFDGSRTYIAGKGTFPINDAFSVYGKLGVGHSKTDTNTNAYRHSKTELYGGVGAQYNLSKQVALTLEYERYGKSKDFGAKADAITVGARYSF